MANVDNSTRGRPRSRATTCPGRDTFRSTRMPARRRSSGCRPTSNWSNFQSTLGAHNCSNRTERRHWLIEFRLNSTKITWRRGLLLRAWIRAVKNLNRCTIKNSEHLKEFQKRERTRPRSTPKSINRKASHLIWKVWREPLRLTRSS